jgi:hypothetical protein
MIWTGVTPLLISRMKCVKPPPRRTPKRPQFVLEPIKLKKRVFPKFSDLEDWMPSMYGFTHDIMLQERVDRLYQRTQELEDAEKEAGEAGGTDALLAVMSDNIAEKLTIGMEIGSAQQELDDHRKLMVEYDEAQESKRKWDAYRHSPAVARQRAARVLPLPYIIHRRCRLV